MIFFQKLIYLFFPHELTCMGSYHLLLKFPPTKHTIFFTKRQCVTSSEIWVTGQTKHRGLGGGPVCFFERDAIFLECSKANFDEFWKLFDIKFWCHTLTHGTVLRRLPLELLDHGSRNPISYGQHKMFEVEPGSLGICQRSNRVVPMESRIQR